MHAGGHKSIKLKLNTRKDDTMQLNLHPWMTDWTNSLKSIRHDSIFVIACTAIIITIKLQKVSPYELTTAQSYPIA
jgi:hypothetical protein